MINQNKLDFYIQNNLNVLFIGKHGTGKTSSVLEAFARNNVRFKYFSVATMDPWVDFVGVPEKVTKDGLTFLELIRPEAFARDEVEGIFLDELNRGDEKTRNAVLELIQFRSINGKKFNNLRFIWGAINPDNDTTRYDVQRLDPAQKDRFVIHVDVPYELDANYFNTKYKKYGNLVTRAIDWWNHQTDTIKNEISPRRLDYALHVYTLGGDVTDVISMYGKSLATALAQDIVSARLEASMTAGNATMATTILKNDSDYTDGIKWILEKEDRCHFFLPLINDEKLVALMKEEYNQPTFKNICSTFDSSDKMRDLILQQYDNGIIKEQIINNMKPVDTVFGKNSNQCLNFNVNKTCTDEFIKKVNDFNGIPHTLSDNKKMYEYIRENIGTTGHGKNGHAAVTILFLVKNMYACKQASVFMSNFPGGIDVMNLCLRSLDNGIDITKDKRFIFANRIIMNIGLQDFIWVP